MTSLFALLFFLLGRQDQRGVEAWASAPCRRGRGIAGGLGWSHRGAHEHGAHVDTCTRSASYGRWADGPLSNAWRRPPPTCKQTPVRLTLLLEGWSRGLGRQERLPGRLPADTWRPRFLLGRWDTRYVQMGSGGLPRREQLPQCNSSMGRFRRVTTKPYRE